MESALREIRISLLEADVNFKVVKAFVDRVRDRAIDRAVLDSLTPAQQVVGIVRDEMLALLGDAAGGLSQTAQRPQVVLILGLQGFGENDHQRQARAMARPAGTASAAGLDRRAPPCGDPSARSAV